MLAGSIAKWLVLSNCCCREPAGGSQSRSPLAHLPPAPPLQEIEKMHSGSAADVRRAQYQRDQQAG